MHSSFWPWLSAVLIVLLAMAIWSLRRQKAPKVHVKCDAPILEVIPSLAGITLSTAIPGNSVRVHENGGFFDVLEQGIRSARKSVHFETFLWKEGTLSRRIAGALIDRARAGVPVRVLLDAAGSRHMDRVTRDALRASGCHLKFFHKRSIQNIGLLNDRDHRKLCIVDGREAFVGGHCIVDHWLGNAEDGEHYSDVSVQLHGPIVHSVQSAFCDNWIGETGELLVGEAFFPPLERAGDVLVHAAYVKPSNSASAVKVLHHSVLCLARKRLWIQNPYFIPEPEAIDGMGEAVRRGVDVRVLVPAVSGSDAPMVQRAGHRNFEKLLASGVRIFEYPHTLLHQKVMTIDGEWCAIGSTNFDDRSFETNDEITLGIADAAITRDMDAIFEKYAARAKEVKLDEWRRRPLHRRLQEHQYYSVNELL